MTNEYIYPILDGSLATADDTVFTDGGKITGSSLILLFFLLCEEINYED